MLRKDGCTLRDFLNALLTLVVESHQIALKRLADDLDLLAPWHQIALEDVGRNEIAGIGQFLCWNQRSLLNTEAGTQPTLHGVLEAPTQPDWDSAGLLIDDLIQNVLTIAADYRAY
ncbi:hypothetical protein D3C80_1893060 [compost metagenome]